MKKIAVLIIFAAILSGCSSGDKDLKKIYNKISDAEPNDTAKQASTVIISDPVVGFFDKNDKNDIDYYKVGIPAKGISYEVSLSAVPGIDARLKIYSESGRLLYTIDELSKGDSEKLWEFYPKTDSIIFSVESKSGYNEKLPYVVNFIKKEEAPAEEIEPNNRENDASVIKLGETKRGFISPKNDIDYYKLDFDDETVHDFSIEIETLSNVDINFLLMNKNASGYKTVNAFSWGGTETFPYLCSDKGDFIIKVSGKLSDDKKDPLYYLSVKELSNTDDENKDIYYEREDNDLMENSTELLSGSESLGCLFPEQDVDWFKFDLYKKPISVDLSISRVKGLDPIIEIYDADGQLIQKINKSGKDNGEQGSLNDLESGKYYIKLYSSESSLMAYKLYLYIRYE